MFTGIIERVGTVAGVGLARGRSAAGTRAHRLDVDLDELAAGLKPGASVAINGVCLTLVESGGTAGSFDVVPETWQRTTLRTLCPGDGVNLERSLRVGDRLEGHFVQGHVEGVGTVARIDRSGGEWTLWVEFDAALRPCIVPKGSIAIDGVSLTVVHVDARQFSVVLIPTTLERTVLGRRQPGAGVNLETDILARVVRHQLPSAGEPIAAATGDVTLERLRESGFVA